MRSKWKIQGRSGAEDHAPFISVDIGRARSRSRLISPWDQAQPGRSIIGRPHAICRPFPCCFGLVGSLAMLLNTEISHRPTISDADTYPRQYWDRAFSW